MNTKYKADMVDRDALLRVLRYWVDDYTARQQVIDALNRCLTTWRELRDHAERAYDSIESALRSHELGHKPQLTLTTNARDLEVLSARLDERMDTLRVLCYTLDAVAGRTHTAQNTLFAQVWSTVTLCAIAEEAK